MVHRELHEPRLGGVFGNETAEMALLHIHMLGKAYVRMISEDCGLPLNTVRNQIQRFAKDGILQQQEIGRQVWFFFNEEFEFLEEVKALLARLEAHLTPYQKSLFESRRRELRALA